MVVAFVFIKVKAARAKHVLNALRKIHGIKEVYALYGQMDIMAKVETESLRDLGNIVTNYIQLIDGIIETSTAIVAEI